MVFTIISFVVLSTAMISDVTGFSSTVSRTTSFLPLQIRNSQPGHNRRHDTPGVSLQAGIFDFMKGDNDDNENVVDNNKNAKKNKKNKPIVVKAAKSAAKAKPAKAKSLFDKSKQSEKSKSYTGVKRS